MVVLDSLQCNECDHSRSRLKHGARMELVLLRLLPRLGDAIHALSQSELLLSELDCLLAPGFNGSAEQKGTASSVASGNGSMSLLCSKRGGRTVVETVGESAGAGSKALSTSGDLLLTLVHALQARGATQARDTTHSHSVRDESSDSDDEGADVTAPGKQCAGDVAAKRAHDGAESFMAATLILAGTPSPSQLWLAFRSTLIHMERAARSVSALHTGAAPGGEVSGSCSGDSDRKNRDSAMSHDQKSAQDGDEAAQGGRGVQVTIALLRAIALAAPAVAWCMQTLADASAPKSAHVAPVKARAPLPDAGKAAGSDDCDIHEQQDAAALALAQELYKLGCRVLPVHTTAEARAKTHAEAPAYLPSVSEHDRDDVLQVCLRVPIRWNGNARAGATDQGGGHDCELDCAALMSGIDTLDIRLDEATGDDTAASHSQVNGSNNSGSSSGDGGSDIGSGGNRSGIRSCGMFRLQSFGERAASGANADADAEILIQFACCNGRLVWVRCPSFAERMHMRDMTMQMSWCPGQPLVGTGEGGQWEFVQQDFCQLHLVMDLSVYCCHGSSDDSTDDIDVVPSRVSSDHTGGARETVERQPTGSALSFSLPTVRFSVDAGTAGTRSGGERTSGCSVEVRPLSVGAGPIASMATTLSRWVARASSSAERRLHKLQQLHDMFVDDCRVSIASWPGNVGSAAEPWEHDANTSAKARSLATEANAMSAAGIEEPPPGSGLLEPLPAPLWSTSLSLQLRMPALPPQLRAVLRATLRQRAAALRQAKSQHGRTSTVVHCSSNLLRGATAAMCRRFGGSHIVDVALPPRPQPLGLVLLECKPPPGVIVRRLKPVGGRETNPLHGVVAPGSLLLAVDGVDTTCLGLDDVKRLLRDGVTGRVSPGYGARCAVFMGAPPASAIVTHSLPTSDDAGAAGQVEDIRRGARTQTGGLRLRVISRQRGSAAAVVSPPATAASKDTSHATITAANASTTTTACAQLPCSVPQSNDTSTSAPPPPKQSDLDPVPDFSVVTTTQSADCEVHIDLDGRRQGSDGDTVANTGASDSLSRDELEAQLQNVSTTPKPAALQSCEKRTSDTDCAQKPKVCCVLQ